MRKDGRSHDKKKPEDLIPKWVRDEQNRKNAKLGGRPCGSYNILPQGTQALLDRLKEKKFRILPEFENDPDANELSALAQDTVVKVMLGKAGRVKAPARLKAAQTVLEQVQKPVIRESKVTGAIDLGAAVSEAMARKINK